MEALRNLTVCRGAHKHEDDDDDDEPFYEDSYVRGIVVPFCWEEKPGVPLRKSTDKYSRELTRGQKLESVMMMRVKHHVYASGEKKGLLIPNQMLLPKPPASNHFQKPITSSSLNKRRHIPPSLVSKRSTPFCMAEPHDVISEDPFMRAMQACRGFQVNIDGKASRHRPAAAAAAAVAVAAPKKPTISQHRRTMSSGLLGCRSVRHYDSIVRIPPAYLR